MFSYIWLFFAITTVTVASTSSISGGEYGFELPAKSVTEIIADCLNSQPRLEFGPGTFNSDPLLNSESYSTETHDKKRLRSRNTQCKQIQLDSISDNLIDPRLLQNKQNIEPNNEFVLMPETIQQAHTLASLNRDVEGKQRSELLNLEPEINDVTDQFLLEKTQICKDNLKNIEFQFRPKSAELINQKTGESSIHKTHPKMENVNFSAKTTDLSNPKPLGNKQMVQHGDELKNEFIFSPGSIKCISNLALPLASEQRKESSGSLKIKRNELTPGFKIRQDAEADTFNHDSKRGNPNAENMISFKTGESIAFERHVRPYRKRQPTHFTPDNFYSSHKVTNSYQRRNLINSGKTKNDPYTFETDNLCLSKRHAGLNRKRHLINYATDNAYPSKRHAKPQRKRQLFKIPMDSSYQSENHVSHGKRYLIKKIQNKNELVEHENQTDYNQKQWFVSFYEYGLKPNLILVKITFAFLVLTTFIYFILFLTQVISRTLQNKK